ncbi:MAG TPA: hypothetical protein VL947_12740, partial [Cytophagales bacterium]|nr:hypothetical protein [Cytophagales bacterium]
KSGYVKLTNLFSYFGALRRYLMIILIKYMVLSGILYMAITLFGTEHNPNTEFTRRPTVADLSLNLILDSVVISDVLLIW